MAHSLKISDDKLLNVYSLSAKEIDAFKDRNKQIRESQRPGGDFEHLYRIPMELYTLWMERHGLQYPPTADCKKKIKQLVQLPEHKFLRTTERAI